MADEADVDQVDEEIEGVDQLGDAGKRALDAMKQRLQEERRKRKELEPLAAKAREADEAAKTEAQKHAEARSSAEKERDEARLSLLKRDAADEAGLPKSWADRLRGATAEELLADAKNLAKDIQPKPAATNARPVADLKSGALPAGDTAPNAANVDAWIRKQAGIK